MTESMRPKECKYCGNDAFYSNALSRAFFCGSRYVYATMEWVQEKNTKCIEKMIVEIVSPTPKQQEFQKLFNQTDKEAILCLTREVEELHAKIRAWEECADNLVDYAHEFLAQLSSWGKGYARYDKEIKQAEDAIEAHHKLKNEKG